MQNNSYYNTKDVKRLFNLGEDCSVAHWIKIGEVPPPIIMKIKHTRTRCWPKSQIDELLKDRKTLP